ncbi:response regulator transcription factor [Chloroflexota bacterium]
MRILIVEDDANVVEAVSLCLQLRWPKIIISGTAEGIKGIEILKNDAIDAVILDINLPDMDGFEVLSKIRSFSDVPVIILTVRGWEDDQIKGLEMGADDYIVKPFRPRDVIARVNSVLRRADYDHKKDKTGRSVIVRGGLSFNLAAGEVKIGEKTILLSPNESRLLYILMENAGQTISNERIAQQVWQRRHVNSELVRTYIQRLRRKMGDNPPKIILTQRSEGYRLVSPT